MNPTTTRPELANVNALAVQLHGRRVGVLNRLAGDRQIFAFEEEYIADPARDTLSLSFKGRTGGLVTAIRPMHRRVPPYFANLLPEGHLRAYLANRAGVNPQREFFVLAALGADLSGAITVAPIGAGGDPEPPPEPAPREGEAGGGGALRFSLAGVQLKFSAVAEASGGLTIPAQGVGGAWIVKLPSLHFPAVPENEFVMLSLARAVGIDVPPARLMPIDEIRGLPAEAARLPGKALVVKRFDRSPAGVRIHMEDFAQVFGLFPEDKYKGVSYSNIARVLWAEAGQEATFEFVRRLAFTVLIGNADMHLKNWSLLYPDGRQAALSPAYDFVSTLPYLPDDRLALTFGGSRSLEEIGLEQTRRFAEKAGLPMPPVTRAIVETVERTEAAWHTLREKKLLAAPIRRAVEEQIKRVAERTRAEFIRRPLARLKTGASQANP